MKVINSEEVKWQATNTDTDTWIQYITSASL